MSKSKTIEKKMNRAAEICRNHKGTTNMFTIGVPDGMNQGKKVKEISEKNDGQRLTNSNEKRLWIYPKYQFISIYLI